MTAGRMAGGDDPGDVEVVLFGVANSPPERAAAIFDGGRCGRNIGHAIFDVDDVPASLKIRKQLRGGAGAVTEDPTAAVNVDHRGNRLFGGLIAPKVELELKIILGAVDDIGIDDVFVAGEFGPPGLVGL